ncbi:MAG: RNA polymerase sigma-70 factor [Gammaproteobacteria bacterium]|nr:MAG: RNA polymerase sigma-70 factor [Gammaproteobacteria bacterium]
MFRRSEEITCDERDLISSLNKGDQLAFEELYNLYSVRILKKLIFLLKDVEIAKEILQEVFLVAWEKRQTVDSDKSFRSFLFRVAENKVVDFYRKAARDKKMREHVIRVSVQHNNHTEEILAEKESSAILQQAIDNLSPQRKRIFFLCRLEGKSYEEAAKILGISAGTVNDHMVKALRVIRTHFKVLKTLPLVLLFLDL